MSKELNKALDLLREIRPSIPKDVLELWCKDRDAFLAQRSEFHQHLKECADEVATWPTYKQEALGPFLGHELGIEGETETANELNKAPVEQAGGDERAAFEYWASDEGLYPKAVERAGNCYKLAQTQSYWMAWQARAALAQPSPAQTQPSPAPTLRAAIDVANDRFEVPVAKWGTDLVGEEERPEVAEVAFVLRNIGAMDAEDIDGDNVDLRFEDAEGRDTGCDVSIVEYAEKAADLFEQHDRIVGDLRAVIAQLRQHKNDYMDSGQETYRALQNEIREREAEIARLDGLVSGRTAERDAALAEVKRIKTISDNYYVLCVERQQQLDAALARVAELERQEPVALANRGLHAFWVKWTEAAAGFYGPGIKLYAAPVAQAQHSVPEGVTIERDVAGTIHIKVGDFDFIQLQYQRPYTDNASTWKLAERIASLLAAAPGKEGV
ncbi:hypothetical protein R4J70_18635 [Pseudomonas aeruginosa]|uniref:hypothetical protein n=1 Tax=Pseudomonas aeruginosa TaxID=287 RepID=UPI0022ACCE30|nr:hypothetical protein [Pseudomonas aeruginosa]MDV7782000.1 hypothetical protein [Pseudomonas aeruginosa]HCT8042327.1 hypothetical protein [Pseudomonas aeruginosa]